MKKKILFNALGALGVAAALVVSGFGFNASGKSITKIDQLNAKGTSYCSPCGCASDCESGATGNIYSGYVAENN